jgi:hypothetical protein
VNAQAPAIAADLHSWLDMLIDHVDDPTLRAAAMGGLGTHYQGNPDVAAAEQPHQGMTR